MSPDIGGVVFTLGIAALVFAVAYWNGGYGLTSRTMLAVGSWLLIMVVVGVGGVPSGRLSRAAVLMLCTFGLFALWTLASTSWAANPERAFAEFNRVSLYYAILLLSVLVVTARRASRFADGLLLGIVAIAVVASASRFFPHLFDAHRLAIAIPGAETRLSFPVGYWNGLGMFVSLGFPLCLRCGLEARTAVVRGAAVAALPLLTTVVYLTSSRGAVITTAAGIVVFLSLAGAEDQRRLVAACAAGSVGSALAVIVLAQRHTLVDGPVDKLARAQPGKVGCGSRTCRLGARRRLVRNRGPRDSPTRSSSPAPRAPGRRRPDRGGRCRRGAEPPGRALRGVQAHPGRDVRERPFPIRQRQRSMAVLGCRSRPVSRGAAAWRGAGSYESWWAQHASFTYFLQNAHSLYLEVLGELGAVGLLLLGVAFAAGLVGGIDRVRSGRAGLRATHAALMAVFVAFLVGAAVDWIWQLAAVAAVALAGLGSVVSLEPGLRSAQTRRRRQVGIGTGVLVLIAAWLVCCAAGVPG